jgi:O-antigen ligase
MIAKNKKKLEISLLICWILTLLSINSNLHGVNEYANYQAYSFKKIIISFNYLRFYLPFVILIFLTSLFFFIKKKFNLILFIFFFYFFYQLILLVFLNDGRNERVQTVLGDKIKNYQLIVNAISTLLIFYYSNIIKFKNFYKKLFIIAITFIALISIFFCIQLILEFIFQKETYYFYVSKTLAAEQLSLLQANPRITGLSRMILLIFFLFYFINISEQKSKLIRYFTFTILFICIFFIYGMQSRGSWIGILLLILMNIFFYKEKVRKKIFTFIVLIVLPIVTFHLFVKIKSYYFTEMTLSKEINQKMTVLKEKDQEKLIHQKERLTSNYSTSGRTEIWRNILLIAIEEKIILGKGPQADRYLLTNYIDKNKEIINFVVYENNASNAILYSYLCAGVFGLFAIIFIYANFVTIIYKNIFIKKNFFRNNILYNFSIVTLSYLLIRSIFENSFSLFSVDFMFLILCYFIISERNNKSIKRFIKKI